jgi:hypothetical protein
LLFLIDFYFLIIAILPGCSGISLQFQFSFSWWLMKWSIFTYWPFVFILLRRIYSDHLSIFKLDYLFFCCYIFEFLDINCQMKNWQIFSPIL